MLQEKDKELLDSVRNIMQENDRVYKAEQALLGEMGIVSRKALPHEQRVEFDAKLAEKLKG